MQRCSSFALAAVRVSPRRVTLAIPKSTILTKSVVPSCSSRKTLSGFMSRWMTLFVNRLQAARDLHGDVAGAQRLDGALAKLGGQGPAGQKLHLQKRAPIVKYAKVGDVDGVGVANL